MTMVKLWLSRLEPIRGILATATAVERLRLTAMEGSE